MQPLERPQSLTAMAVTTLRRAIVSGDLALGEQLSEGALARRLGISKTPVREALQQLRMEGLVRIVPQTGTFVFSLSAKEVADLCELRLTLERAALRLALERNRALLASRLDGIVVAMEQAQAAHDMRAYLDLDTAFHAEFFALGDNPYLAAAHDNIAGQIAAVRTHLAARPRHTTQSMAEHRRIGAAVREARDADLLLLLEEHVGRTRASYAAHVDDIAQADRVYDANRRARQPLARLPA